MHRLLVAVTSFVVAHELRGVWASVAAALGLHTWGSWAPGHRLSSCGAGVAAPWHWGPSRIRNQTCVSCIGRRILHHWATRGPLPFCVLRTLLRVVWWVSKARYEAGEEGARARSMGSPDTVNDGGWQVGPDPGRQWREITIFWDIAQCCSIKGYKWCYSSQWKTVMTWLPQAGDSRGHVLPCQCDGQLAGAGMARPAGKDDELQAMVIG